MKRNKKLYTIAVIAFVLFSMIYQYMTEPDMNTGEFLEVHFLDVGQADSIFIKKGSEAMIIDAGNNKDGKFVVDYLREQGVKTLKYAIGTHPHADHIGGLDDVIDNFDIETIIMPNKMANTKTFEEVLDSIADKGLKITAPVVGDKYDLNGAQFTILAPNRENYSSTNDYSIVIKLVNGSNSFLFTGDAEALSEREMLENNIWALKSKVLKVGHHGSVTSTSPEFLEAVNPEVAVISSGEGNTYGHPHEEILEILEEKDITILRTDMLGTIVIKADGENIAY
ncbi:MAG: MBL fold metallo-hydrolase [Tissierellaceae bacterium]|nr:MBL fold metallo-hydrolase [Tissierellaceae bacterium]